MSSGSDLQPVSRRGRGRYIRRKPAAAPEESPDDNYMPPDHAAGDDDLEPTKAKRSRSSSDGTLSAEQEYARTATALGASGDATNSIEEIAKLKRTIVGSSRIRLTSQRERIRQLRIALNDKSLEATTIKEKLLEERSQNELLWERVGELESILNSSTRPITRPKQMPIVADEWFA